MHINYSALLPTERAPSLGSVLNRQDDDGPRTTSASVAVANHIRSFYRLFAVVGVILAMIAFGIIAIIFGHIKRNACPGSENVPTLFIVFGTMVIIVSIVSIIIVIARVTCCYHRSGLLCCYVLTGMALLSMVFFSIVMIATNGIWMQIFMGFIIKSIGENANCDDSVRYFTLLITLCVYLAFFSPFLYMCIARCKLQRERTDDSAAQFITLT